MPFSPMSNILPRSLLLPFFALFALLATGCVTNIKTDVLNNPPPAEKFSNFNRFEIGRITLVPPYAGQEANEKALVKIQENLDLRATPLLASWNEKGAASTPARTLVITPVVTEVKFIGAGTRVWVGGFAGSSAVILRVEITEKETGKVVANPHFYARAAAISGAWSFGAADNAMLVRVANRLSDYLEGNYSQAVGGRTGQDPEK